MYITAEVLKISKQKAIPHVHKNTTSEQKVLVDLCHIYYYCGQLSNVLIIHDSVPAKKKLHCHNINVWYKVIALITIFIRRSGRQGVTGRQH